MGTSIACATASAFVSPLARMRIRRASRIVPMPMVMAHFGIFSPGMKDLRLSSIVSLVRLQPRPRSEARRRFVESNVAIAPDTKNLQVDATCRPDFLFVRRTILFVLAGNHSIGNVSSRGIDVDMAKEILAHKKVKALRMIGRDPEVSSKLKVVTSEKSIDFSR